MDEKKLEAVRRLKKRIAELMPAGVEVVGVGIGLTGSEPALKVNLRAGGFQRAGVPRAMPEVRLQRVRTRIVLRV